MNKYLHHFSEISSVVEVKNLISDTLEHFNNNSLREFYNNIRKHKLFTDKKISILEIDIRDSKIRFSYENNKDVNSFYLGNTVFKIDVKNKRYKLKEFVLETEFGCVSVSPDTIFYYLKDNKPDFHYYDVISIELMDGKFQTIDLSDFSEYDFSIRYNTDKLNYLNEEYKVYKSKAVTTLKQLKLIANVDAELFLDFIIFNKSFPDNIIDICQITNDTSVDFDLKIAKSLQVKSDFKSNKMVFKNE